MPNPTLEVGYVARAHGLGGELAVKTFDPASEVLLDVERVVLRDRTGREHPHVVESARTTKDEILLSLAGVDDRTGAEALRGATVLVHREDLEPPAEGEWFQGDLVGLEARTPEGAPLGRVTEIWNTGPVPNLVITGGPAGELVVPFVDAYVPEVDVAAGTCTVRPPEVAE